MRSEGSVSGYNILRRSNFKLCACEKTILKMRSENGVACLMNSAVLVNRNCRPQCRYSAENLARLTNGDLTLLRSVIEVDSELGVLKLVSCEIESKGLAVGIECVALGSLYLGKSVLRTDVHFSVARSCVTVSTRSHSTDKVASLVKLLCADREILSGSYLENSVCKRLLCTIVHLVNIENTVLNIVFYSHLMRNGQRVSLFGNCGKPCFVMFGNNIRLGSRLFDYRILEVRIDRQHLLISLGRSDTICIGLYSADNGSFFLNNGVVYFNILGWNNVESNALYGVVENVLLMHL